MVLVVCPLLKGDFSGFGFVYLAVVSSILCHCLDQPVISLDRHLLFEVHSGIPEVVLARESFYSLFRICVR